MASCFLAAAPTGTPRQATEYAWLGGQDAMGRLACKEAAQRFQQVFQALDLSGPIPPSRHAEVLLALGEARRQAGELQPAMATFTEAATAARAAKTPELLAQAALDFEEAFLPTGLQRADPSDHLRCLQEEALRALDPARRG